MMPKFIKYKEKLIVPKKFIILFFNIKFERSLNKKYVLDSIIFPVKNNGPWSQLSNLENIDLIPLKNNISLNIRNFYSFFIY